MIRSPLPQFYRRGIKGQRVGRHPEGNSLQGILEVGDAAVKVRWVKGEKKLCIVSIKVMI